MTYIFLGLDMMLLDSVEVDKLASMLLDPIFATIEAKGFQVSCQYFLNVELLNRREYFF